MNVRHVLADGFASVDEIDAGDGPMAAKERAGHVRKISDAAGGSTENEADIVAIKRCARSELAKHSAEMTDADTQKFCKSGLLLMVRTGFPVLHLKARHAIGEPEMPRLGVVGGHTQAMLGSGMQFIEKVSIDSDSCSDHEVTRARLPFEILVLSPAQRYPARRGADHGFRGAHYICG